MAVPRPGRTRAAIRIVIGGLLAAVLIGTLWVPFHNHLTPALGEFPFYWYQLMWVPIVAILSGIAYLLSRLAQRGSRPPEATTSGGARAMGAGPEETK